MFAKDTAAGVGHTGFLTSGAGGQFNAQISRATTDATAVVAYPAGFVGAAVWKFVVMLYKAGDGGPRIYIGDHRAAMAEPTYASRTDGVGGVTDVSANTFLIGASNQAAGNVFQGRIAHFSVWNGAMTLAQADKLRQFPNPVGQTYKDMILLGFFPMDDFAGDNIRDFSGNKVVAAITGATRSNLPAREADGSMGF